MFRPYRVIIRMISETLMKYTNHIMVERSHFLQIILQSSLFVFSSVLKFSDCSSFIHSVFCLTTGPKPPPKRCLHIVRSRASSFKWEYPLLSLRSSSSFLRLLPRLLATSISPFIFPSITCFRRQFLRKMWPIQLAFRFLISCRIFLCSLTLRLQLWNLNLNLKSLNFRIGRRRYLIFWSFTGWSPMESSYWVKREMSRTCFVLMVCLLSSFFIYPTHRVAQVWKIYKTLVGKWNEVIIGS